MTTMLEYKGYMGSVDFSDEDEVFHGRLEFIRDLVTYEATDARSLKQTFHEAVDDHLALCAEQGRTPDEPLKGSFNVRPGPDLHRRAMLFARRRGLNLNTVVSDALREYLDQKDRVVHAWGHVVHVWGQVSHGNISPSCAILYRHRQTTTHRVPGCRLSRLAADRGTLRRAPGNHRANHSAEDATRRDLTPGE